MQVKLRRRGFFRRPCGVRVPGVRSALKCAGLPGRLLALAVQVIAEERSLEFLAELTRRLVPAKWNQADAFFLIALPLAVKPWPRHHEIGVFGIALFGV